jgi:hypothetical protein
MTIRLVGLLTVGYVGWPPACRASDRNGISRESRLRFCVAVPLHTQRYTHRGSFEDRIDFREGSAQGSRLHCAHFNWQLLYEFGPSKAAPRGTRLDVTGVWDNSAANRSNPDPKADVRWGDQSWEEMLIAWVTMQIDPHVDVNTLFQNVDANGTLEKAPGDSGRNDPKR